MLQNSIQTIWFVWELDSNTIIFSRMLFNRMSHRWPPSSVSQSVPSNPCVTQRPPPELCVTKCPHLEPLCHKVPPLCLCVVCVCVRFHEGTSIVDSFHVWRCRDLVLRKTPSLLSAPWCSRSGHAQPAQPSACRCTCTWKGSSSPTRARGSQAPLGQQANWDVTHSKPYGRTSANVFGDTTQVAYEGKGRIDL